MTIKLYQNSAEPNKVDKSEDLSLVAELTGTLREACSITSPVVQLEETGSNPLRNANYMYIVEFDRYYYISDITARGHLWEVRAKCDVLMSFKSDILNTTAVIARNLALGDKQINDASAIIHQRPLKYKKHSGFKSFDFDNGSYVLAVAGGGGNV